MTKWVALLRGVNVGGNNKLPMADLKALCTGIWPDAAPQTYIASGNLIFDADGSAADVASALGQAISAKFGFEVLISVTQADTFQDAVAACPYDGSNGKGIHGFFCFAPPKPNWDHINKLAVAGEGVDIAGNIIWLHTPQGMSKSKLANSLTAAMGHAPMTARNLNTLRKVSEMLDG